MDYRIIKVVTVGGSEGITLPKEVKMLLGVKPGDYLKLMVVDNKIILEKVK